MEQRTTAPKKGDKWYSTQNPFAGGKYDMFKNNGNCTHYCYGRASEVLGKKSNMPTCDAVNWYKTSKKSKGQEPRVGAVIVYKHKNKNSGHVAFVEEKKSNGNLILSMSGWKSFIFKRREVTKANNYCYGDYELLGFIYTIDEEVVETKKNYSGEYPKLPTRGYFKTGDKGSEVKKLQALLNWANGSKITCDGVYGKNTNTQVGLFQKNYGLTVDYKWGKKCLAKSKEITK